MFERHEEVVPEANCIQIIIYNLVVQDLYIHSLSFCKKHPPPHCPRRFFILIYIKLDSL